MFVRCRLRITAGLGFIWFHVRLDSSQCQVAEWGVLVKTALLDACAWYQERVLSRLNPGNLTCNVDSGSIKPLHMKGAIQTKWGL